MAAQERARIRAYSPDRSIKVTYEEANDLFITGHPERSRTHSETGLAEQMQACLTSLLTEHRQGRRPGQDAGDLTSDDPGARIAWERNEKLTKRLQNAAVTGRSSRESVAIGLHPLKGFRVKVSPGSIARFGVTGVIDEANSALHNAFSKARAKAADIHREIFCDLSADQIDKELRERRNQYN